MSDVQEKTVMVPLGDREIEMRAPTEGALVVLSRVGRNMPKIKNVTELTDDQRDHLVRDLGTLGKIVESMVVTEDDREWLDEVMIDGTVTAENVFDAIRVCGEMINGAGKQKAPTTGPVRRRR